jgi:hypothetical protein
MFLSGRIGEGCSIDTSMDGTNIRFKVDSLPDKS